MKPQITRRDFLKSTATTAAAFTILPGGLARAYAANEKVNVACVGVGKILVSDASRPRLIPEAKMQEFKRPEPFLGRIPGGHKQDWLNAVKGGPPAGCDFALYGGPLAEVVLLGNVAVRVGRKIEWDAANLKAKNAPEADPYLRRDYRKGWEF